MKLLSYRIGTLHDDVSEMKTSMRVLAEAVTKLALVEDRQEQAANAMERSFRLMEGLETRVSTIEKSYPGLKKTEIWVDRAVWGIVVAVSVFVAKRLGLL